MKRLMEKEIIITKDGSHSLFIAKINETYHSNHGAILESTHVFIKNGIKHHPKQNLNILEIGFGTGLNTLLSIQNTMDKNVHYTSTEPFPIHSNIYTKLNYYKLCNTSKESFTRLHTEKWEIDINITSNFIFHKTIKTFQKLSTDKKFDIIYFDAFAPDKQPEMWNEDIFIKCYKLLNKDGFIVSYCAKGIVKRTLKKVGFHIENLKGPPGKREMIRANKL